MLVLLDRATLSDVLGAASILAWLGAQVPQLVENYRNQSVAGLSLPFLVSWFAGDTTNLLGCVLTHQLPFQTYLASYFVFVDVGLLSQWIYYARRNPPPRFPPLSLSIEDSLVAGVFDASPVHYHAARPRSKRRHTTSMTGAGELAHNHHSSSGRRRRKHAAAAGEHPPLAASWLSETSNNTTGSSSRSGRRHGGMRAVSEPTYTPGLVASSSATASGPSPTAEQAAAAEAERRGRTMSRTFNSIHSASEGNLRSSVHFSSEDYFGPDAGSGTRRSLSRALSAGSSRSATRSGANSSGSRPPHPPMSHRQASQSQQVVFLSVSIATAFHALAARMALAAPTSMSASDAGGTHAPATNVEWIPRRAPNASLSHPFLFTTTRTEDDAEELPQRFWRRAADERGEVELQFAPSDLAAKENWVSFEADADASRDHTKPKPPPRRGPPDWERIIGRISAWACATLYLTSRLPQLWWNFRRQSVEGLSMLLFTMAFCGNLLYVLSIVLNPLANDPSKRFLLESLPYLLGSGGTLLFDITIVTQSFLYSEARLAKRAAAAHSTRDLSSSYYSTLSTRRHRTSKRASLPDEEAALLADGAEGPTPSDDSGGEGEETIGRAAGRRHRHRSHTPHSRSRSTDVRAPSNESSRRSSLDGGHSSALQEQHPSSPPSAVDAPQMPSRRRPRQDHPICPISEEGESSVTIRG